MLKTRGGNRAPIPHRRAGSDNATLLAKAHGGSVCVSSRTDCASLLLRAISEGPLFEDMTLLSHSADFVIFARNLAYSRMQSTCGYVNCNHRKSTVFSQGLLASRLPAALQTRQARQMTQKGHIFEQGSAQAARGVVMPISHDSWHYRSGAWRSPDNNATGLPTSHATACGKVRSR